MIAVVHTFGSNIRFNPHVHALIPEIKIMGKEVKEMGYLDYEYFKMVRSYGVYAGSINVKIKKCFGLLKYIKSGLKAIQYTLKINWKNETRKMNYRELMIANFSKDPMKCLKCGEIMELWQIWHRKYGYIYDMRTY